MSLINAAEHPGTTLYRIEAPGLNRVDLKRDALHRLISNGRWLNAPILDAMSIHLNAVQGATKIFVVETTFFTRLADVGYVDGKLWNLFRVSFCAFKRD